MQISVTGFMKTLNQISLHIKICLFCMSRQLHQETTDYLAVWILIKVNIIKNLYFNIKVYLELLFYKIHL